MPRVKDGYFARFGEPEVHQRTQEALEELLARKLHDQHRVSRYI